MITRLLVILSLFLSPAIAQAQLRPGAFTTLTTTDIGDESLKVGCPVGTTAPGLCQGGVDAGIIHIYRGVGGYSETLAQLQIRGSGIHDPSSPDQILAIGYNTFIDQAYIQSIHVGTGYTSLNLQPNGGNVAIPVGGFLQCAACVVNADLDVTGVTAAVYGSTTAIFTATINEQGRVTAATNIPLSSLGIPILTAPTNTFTGTLIWGTTAVMSWNTKSTATTYTALSDGFVVAIVDCSGGGGCSGSIDMLSDTSTPPTTLRGAMNAPDGEKQSAMIPVRKGDTYRVDTVTGGGSPVFTVYWVPLGTGG